MSVHSRSTRRHIPEDGTLHPFITLPSSKDAFFLANISMTLLRSKGSRFGSSIGLDSENIALHSCKLRFKSSTLFLFISLLLDGVFMHDHEM
jgi:hypothetical protein